MNSQRGLTLFLALIVLVAMMLSGIALFRTADSGVFVAGNIALQKSATRQGDFGTERGIERINRIPGTCEGLPDAEGGYVEDGLAHMPSSSQTWADWWATYAQIRAVAMPQDSNTGNTVSYLILRLCEGTGKPFSGSRCSGPPNPRRASNQSSNESEVQPAILHFLITSRIQGPNNTLSYVQTLVSCWIEEPESF
jgi:hypothetical protein